MTTASMSWTAGAERVARPTPRSPRPASVSRAVPDVECAEDTPRCLTRSGAAEGFCSKQCATAPVPPAGMEPPLPPKENQVMCRDGYSGPGTPFCAAPLEESGNITWLCIVACGDTPMFDFGECPANLVCVQDDPTVNGYCFPPI